MQLEILKLPSTPFIQMVKLKRSEKREKRKKNLNYQRLEIV